MSNKVESHFVPVNGAPMHLLRTGQGPTLILLHGYPEFSLTWSRVAPLLSDRFDLIMPDLRGFGQSLASVDGPSDQIDRDAHAADIAALADALGLERFGLVSHDVGAYAAQELTYLMPDRIAGLFFFNCPYPGIGNRWLQPDYLKESWYQYFQQTPAAASIVGATPDSIRAYIGQLLRRWSFPNDAFVGLMDEWVRNYAQPNALQGSFNWYLSNNRYRMSMMKGTVVERPPISVKTCVRWGSEEIGAPAIWGDRMGDYFSDLDYAEFEGAGHFPHMEHPERAAAEIGTFFGKVFA